MLAGTSDMTWYTPNNRISVTCDTTVEITETEAYLINFTLDGWAMIWRMRSWSACSDAQMCEKVGCPSGSVTGASPAHAARRGRIRHGATLAWRPIQAVAAGAAPPACKRLLRATSPNQCALGLGRRSKVPGATATSPNLGPYPRCHSKLSN